MLGRTSGGRPGGRLVLFCPNRGWPFEQHGIYWRGHYRFGNIPLVNYLPRVWRDQLAPHIPGDIRQPEIPPLVAVRQLLVLHAQQVQHGRVQVVHMHLVLRDVEAEIVGRPQCQARLHAAASHPDRVVATVMVTTVVLLLDLALAVDGTTELATPNDERILEQARSRLPAARRQGCDL